MILKDYGEAMLAQNKIFNPIKPRTTAVIGHGITTRHVEQRKTSRCRRTRRAVPCSRRRPSRPRTVRPSAPDATPLRYPHVQGGSTAIRNVRFATVARRGRGRRLLIFWWRIRVLNRAPAPHYIGVLVGF